MLQNAMSKMAKSRNRGNPNNNSKMPELRAIGERVKSLRDQTGRTQEELSKTAKVARNIVSNIEVGKNYTMKQLVKVLAALSSDVHSVHDITKIVEEHREVHSRVNEMLMFGDPWDQVVTEAVASVYRTFRKRKKR